VRQGVFCELGKGEIDFPSPMKELEKLDYDGWGVVEQDVLPGMGKPKESAKRNREYIRSLGYSFNPRHPKNEYWVDWDSNPEPTPKNLGGCSTD
jgi:hypothetical protein